MKYAHLADLHLGSWRDPKMRDLSTKAFLLAMEDCVQQQVDFILFAGDIFNTSLPSLDILKLVTKKLKEFQDLHIPIYVIAGSHDFSPSGKTMIDILEHAGLLKNVCKGTVNPETQQLHLQFTVDHKTGAKLTGILGRKGQLDRSYYENLALEHLEAEPGYKIFLFHTSLTELKPKHLEKIESYPASFLPKHFNYYAGGHLHHKTMVELPDYGPLTYPGALFPNNFMEVEKYSHGGYYIVTTQNVITAQNGAQVIEWRAIIPISHRHLAVNCAHTTPEQAMAELERQLSATAVDNSLITIQFSGILEQGKVSDLPLKGITDRLLAQGAYFVMKNTAQLQSPQFEEIKIASSNQEALEEELIREHLQQNTLFSAEKEYHLTKTLLAVLNTTKKEGETVNDFQVRVEQEIDKLLNL